MVDLVRLDKYVGDLVEMLDPNATTEAPGEHGAGAPRTTVGAGPAQGAGISGAQHTQHVNSFAPTRAVPASLGLDMKKTVVGPAAPRSSDPGISNAQHTQHVNSFSSKRSSPAEVLGLGKAGKSAGSNLDSAS